VDACRVHSAAQASALSHLDEERRAALDRAGRGCWIGRFGRVCRWSARAPRRLWKSSGRERGRQRLGWLLAHASESFVRSQVAEGEARSEHTGDSRNRGKGGHWRGPSQRPTVAGVEMRTFGDEQGAAEQQCDTCIVTIAVLGLALGRFDEFLPLATSQSQTCDHAPQRNHCGQRWATPVSFKADDAPSVCRPRQTIPGCPAPSITGSARSRGLKRPMRGAGVPAPGLLQSLIA
jgi:hypothetical protein